MKKILLIIFLITIPIFGISVNVNLPAQAARGQGNADYVVISVDKSGELYLNNTVAPDIQALSSLMQSIASGNPQPELHIRADAQAPFAHVQQVIDTAQGHGFSRVSLITEPAQK